MSSFRDSHVRLLENAQDIDALRHKG
jgi:hypothetical protein